MNIMKTTTAFFLMIGEMIAIIGRALFDGAKEFSKNVDFDEQIKKEDESGKEWNEEEERLFYRHDKSDVY